MRIIHFADLHIGVETYGRPVAGQAWSSRMQDFLDAFDALVEYAVAERVDAVIFAGDAYKAREPTQTHQREFAKRIQRLSAAAIPTFLLAGNHDLPNAESRAHALEIFRTLAVPHVYVGDNDWFAREGYRPMVIPTRDGPLQVAFLPWPQISRLLASNDDISRMTIEQVHSLVESKLAGLVGEQVATLDPQLPAILTCHISINDFLVRDNQGSERWMTVGTAPTVLKTSLHQEAFDYIALGHHHNNMSLNMQTPCWYAGSMQPVDFGEAAQKKGFMVVDIDPSKPLGGRISQGGAPRLHEVPTRPFVTVEVRPSAADPMPEVMAAVRSANVTDAIVRVLAHMDPQQAVLFRPTEVRDALGAAHNVAYVRAVVPEESRQLLPPNEQPDSASPIESLETYLKLQDTPDERRHRLLARAAELMDEIEAETAESGRQ